MKWWKVGLYCSIAWILLMVALAAGLIWNISSHPHGAKIDEAREESAGGLVGMLLGGGLVAIWLYAYIRHKSRAAAIDAESGRTDFAPCPVCSSHNSRKVTFTWWGGLLGPALFQHVKCLGCGTTFNGRTGKSNAVPIAVYLAVSFVIALVLLVVAALAWAF